MKLLPVVEDFLHQPEGKVSVFTAGRAGVHRRHPAALADPVDDVNLRDQSVVDRVPPAVGLGNHLPQFLAFPGGEIHAEGFHPGHDLHVLCRFEDHALDALAVQLVVAGFGKGAQLVENFHDVPPC